MRAFLLAIALVAVSSPGAVGQEDQPLFLDPIDVDIPHVSTDPNIRLDYDIVYVRAARAGDEIGKRFYADFSQPVTFESGADLMLLHPDGSEELLVTGGQASVTDPFVSFDGQWVYYSLVYQPDGNQWNPPAAGADIFKIHVPSRKIVKLTNQVYTPNTGAANWAPGLRQPAPGKSHIESGVFNMGPCPLPGGRIVFTSNRDGFRPAKGYPAVATQLFVMDDRDESIGPRETPTNLEKIGYLNISGALHPVVLTDGRLMFSSLESQGARSEILWGIWTIRPDGTLWAPLISAFDPIAAPDGFHFQTQLSDGSIVVTHYYNQNNSGFGAFVKLPASPPKDYAPFGPAWMGDPRNVAWRYGRFYNGKGKYFSMPFMPTGSVSLTPFTHGVEGPADPSDLKDKNSPAVGKLTHPSGAPDNHLLAVYSPGPVNHQYKHLPHVDGGIYLLPRGEIASEPAQLRLIKNDPAYNEQWPRALVPYKRIYGIEEPTNLPRVANDGRSSSALPEGTPFGLVGTSSFYKRESYPNGVVREGSVTATFAGRGDHHPWKGLDPFTSHGNGPPLNWNNQGSDAGLYENDEIHAVRIIAMEPTTRRSGAQEGRRFYNHAFERLRILGEIPLRKFTRGEQFPDPDGNPDTSFLARIPADTAFTFQTIDKHGMVLNSAQTWHQLRPGEIRHDCGGCHAHSQQPTDFAKTAAARSDYEIWDLVNETPVIVAKELDESQTQWDAENETGVRDAPQGALSVEYFRHVRPILQRSCAACHTARDGGEPAAKLNLDADGERRAGESIGNFPGTYFRLALDGAGKFGHRPVGWNDWGGMQASRYVRKFQSRRSLLVWKLYGRRLDGFHNDDHPSEAGPGEQRLLHRGEEVDVERFRSQQDLDYTGGPMPPPEAVAAGKVEPLTDEDRRTIVRWIDLGCPIDQDFNPNHPELAGRGWMLDESRPIIAITSPAPGRNAELARILVGVHDFGAGLLDGSLDVTADFECNGTPPGKNLFEKFSEKSQGVWELRLDPPVAKLKRGKLSVTVRDRQGNRARVERTFSVGGD